MLNGAVSVRISDCQLKKHAEVVVLGAALRVFMTTNTGRVSRLSFIKQRILCTISCGVVALGRDVSVEQMGDRKCGSVRVSLRVYSSPPLRTKKRRPLSYSDMTHAMSATSDDCSSFNCMSPLNDGTLNSNTFHTIAFHTGRGLGRRRRVFCGHMEREAELSGASCLNPRTTMAATLYRSCRRAT